MAGVMAASANYNGSLRDNNGGPHETGKTNRLTVCRGLLTIKALKRAYYSEIYNMIPELILYYKYILM